MHMGAVSLSRCDVHIMGCLYVDQNTVNSIDAQHACDDTKVIPRLWTCVQHIRYRSTMNDE
jgi:hypothetical protein